jgi:phosphatidylglycerophosphate synthase
MENSAFIISIMLLFSTDAIDGTLARKYNVQTLYGSIMDTIADKALSMMLLLILISKINIATIMLILEFVIAIINTIAFIKGKNPESSIFGKIKMWLISMTIVLGYVCYFDIINDTTVIVGTIVTTMAQLIVIIDYLKKLIKKEKNIKPIFKLKNKKELKEILFDTEYYMNIYKKKPLN